MELHCAHILIFFFLFFINLFFFYNHSISVVEQNPYHNALEYDVLCVLLLENDKSVDIIFYLYCLHLYYLTLR